MNLIELCAHYSCEGTTLSMLRNNRKEIDRICIPLHELTGTAEYKKRALRQAIMLGDGCDKPRGVLACDEVPRIEGPATLDRVIDAIYTVPAEYRRNGVFVVGMPQEPGQDVRRLVDADGRYAWEAAPMAGQAGRLLGFPLLHVEGVRGVVFGSFKDGYALGSRPGLVGGDVKEPDAFCAII